jgi:hypothetical protein
MQNQARYTVTMADAPTFWINTVIRDHVVRGVAGGFTQAGHGKQTMLKRLKRGDYLVFYAPKSVYEDGEPLQKFVALGLVADDEPYQITMTADFMPWRRKVDFIKAKEASIRPLIGELSFITDPTHWGYMFRFGLFKIPAADFVKIAVAMGVAV